MTKIEQRTYASRGASRTMAIDVYRPDGAPKAAVLLFHGGGWRRGSREMMAPPAKVLAANGFIAFGVEYRLLGEAAWPAHIQDVRSALRWVHAHANEFGFPPDKIVLQGFSAGGHLSLVAAGQPPVAGFDYDGEPTTTPKLAAVVAVYPPTEFSIEKPRPAGVLRPDTLLGEGADQAAALKASPSSYIDKSYPPTLLVHGNADQLVPQDASLRMYGKLREAGVPVEMHLMAGQAHGFLSVPSLVPQLQQTVINFLERTVVDPAGHAAECLKFNRFVQEDAERAAAKSSAAAG